MLVGRIRGSQTQVRDVLAIKMNKEADIEWARNYGGFSSDVGLGVSTLGD